MIVAATNRGVVLVSGDTSEIALASDVRCLAAGGGLLYAGSEREGVFRSENGGATWRLAGLAGRQVELVRRSSSPGWRRG